MTKYGKNIFDVFEVVFRRYDPTIMLISHNNGQTDNQVDDSVLDRIRVMEAELDDV